LREKIASLSVHVITVILLIIIMENFVFNTMNITSVPALINFSVSTFRKTSIDRGGNDVIGTMTGTVVNISADTPLYLSTAEGLLTCSEQTFNTDINTSTGSSQQVSGAQAYITFDPAKLEVIDAGNTAYGTQITPGNSLSTVLENMVDNNTGLISYSAGKLRVPFPSGSFTVATIQFRSRTIPSALTTEIQVSFNGSTGISMVDLGGTAIPNDHGNTAVNLVPGAAVDIYVKLPGGSPPDDGWRVPLRNRFFTQGAGIPVDSITANPVYNFN